jgi:hypothetical protein
MGENAIMRRVTAASLVVSACVLCPQPARAQSYNSLEQPRVSVSSVQHYVASEAIPRQLAAPPNLVVSRMFRPLVESMLRDSPTFRRQCLRIAGAPDLTVRLEIRGAPSRLDVRATTKLTRQEHGRLSAVIDISVRHDVEELIAHEFEHIIEQLDGVDLASWAKRPHTGVSSLLYDANVFETTRAKQVGLKVVSELAR